MSEEDIFSAYYTKLNKAQKEAVDAIDGPVMVIAGPGTGKTQILTLRIANILRLTDTQPEQILALTFTKSGVYSMRKRLSEIAGSRAYKVRIHTFHGFCNEIIQDYPEDFPTIIGSNPAGSVDRIEIMEEAIGALESDVLRPFNEPFRYLTAALSEIDHLKRENISPEHFTDIVRDQAKSFDQIPDLFHDKGAHKGKMKGKYADELKKIEKNQELCRLYQNYENGLRARRLYDYGDMIMAVVSRLEVNEDLRLRLQEEYQYILADEHQDANQSQNRLLELLSSFHENPNLFIVGDEKQAIFQFQGASLDNFDYFKRLYPGARVIALTENYRSTQGVLDAAHDLIGKSPVLSESRRVALAAAARVEKGPAIRLRKFGWEEAELRFAAAEVKRLVEAGTPLEEIAILYRDNKDAAAMAPHLDRQRLPYQIESNEDALSDVELAKLLILLESVQDLGINGKMMNAIHLDFLKLPNIDMYKIARATTRQRLTVDIISSRSELETAGVADPEVWLNFWKKVARWNTFAHNEPLLLFLEMVVNESGYLDHLLTLSEAPDKIAKLRRLFKEARTLVEHKKDARLPDLLAHLEMLRSHNLPLAGAERVEPTGVRLMTAHRSKGLEFEYVFIIQARDGHWGNKRRPNVFAVPTRGQEQVGRDETDDERRLFYVALTRAKREVFISFAETAGEDRRYLPSQFVEEIRPELVIDEDMAAVEEEYAADLSYDLRAAPRRETVPLSDKEYLNQLFEAQGLSVSALNNYLSCPWKYFFRNLLRLPEVRGRAALYGTAVHDALERFFNLYRTRGELPPVEILVSLFDDAVNKEPLSEHDYTLMKAKGEKALPAYYEAYRNDWIANVITEYKATVHEFLPGLKLVGKLDKLEFVGDGVVNVVDYKTKKPMTRNEIEGKTKAGTGDFKRQLVFYKLLLERGDDKKYRMASGEIDFLEPDEKGRFKKEKFEITEAEARELEEVIKVTTAGIQSLSFWNEVCDDDKCEYCRLRRMMGAR